MSAVKHPGVEGSAGEARRLDPPRPDPPRPEATRAAVVSPAPVVPTDEQRQAIEFGLQPLRIIAGAGTGKTMVMVERVAHLVATGEATPDQMLGLTFTNKAAFDLKQKVDRRLGADADVMVTTYHGFGAGLVARHLLELDLHPRTRLLNRAEAWQLLFLVFDELRFDKKRVFRPGTVVNDALTLASHCADHLVDCRGGGRLRADGSRGPVESPP